MSHARPDAGWLAGVRERGHGQRDAVVRLRQLRRRIEGEKRGNWWRGSPRVRGGAQGSRGWSESSESTAVARRCGGEEDERDVVLGPPDANGVAGKDERHVMYLADSARWQSVADGHAHVDGVAMDARSRARDQLWEMMERGSG